MDFNFFFVCHSVYIVDWQYEKIEMYALRYRKEGDHMVKARTKEIKFKV